jgi:hypothetical protein
VRQGLPGGTFEDSADGLTGRGADGPADGLPGPPNHPTEELIQFLIAPHRQQLAGEVHLVSLAEDGISFVKNRRFAIAILERLKFERLRLGLTKSTLI